MTLKPLSQNKKFKFSSENEKYVEKNFKKYPKGRQASAVKALLDLAQRQCGGWLPKEALEEVATRLDVPLIKVYEVVSFYTMFNLRPVGKHHIKICTTTPCWLRGSDALVGACKNHLGIGFNQTSKDNKFSLQEVECLGACVNAPMIQVNDDYFEDLDESSMTDLLKKLGKGEKVTPGPQVDRQTSAPVGWKKGKK